MVGKVLQRLDSNTKIDTTSPVLKSAEIIKPILTSKELKLQEEIKKQIPPPPPQEVIKIVPIEAEPIIVTPVEEPPYVPPTPPSSGGGGGGGGGYIERDYGNGMGRERVFEYDMERRENLR